MTRTVLIVLPLALAACDRGPQADALPVGERCGGGLVEDYDARSLCRKGDTIETRRPAAYCDFNYPVVARSKSNGGLGDVVTCVYVGELRKVREVGEDQARGLVSDKGQEALAEAQRKADAAAAEARRKAEADAQARAEAEARQRALIADIAAGMIEIPGGTFQMGCSPGDTQCESYEKPAHAVTVRPLRMGKYEVTQAQWQAVMGANPSQFKGDGRPVETVSWDEVQEFLKRLNAGVTGKPYRLPTEAEWEYGARGGTTTPYWWGKEPGKGNAACSGCGSQWDGKETAPVGSFKPNPFGLYDTVGNVWEWVQDCYHDNYQGAPTDGSEWLDSCSSTRRVVRGGSWNHLPRRARVSFRFWNGLDDRLGWRGVRLAQDL